MEIMEIALNFRAKANDTEYLRKCIIKNKQPVKNEVGTLYNKTSIRYIGKYKGK